MLEQEFLSVAEMIELNARARPNEPALIDSAGEVSWRSLDGLVTASANAWIAQGLGRAQPVAMLIDSSRWSWIHLFGVLRAGGVAAPLNTMLGPEAIHAQLADARATHLLVSRTYGDLAAAVIPRIGPNEPCRIVCSEDGVLAGTVDIGAAAAAASADRSTVVLRPDDPATIIYSSGTTGTPKGIVHSHRARAQMALILASVFRCSSSCRLLLTTPPHTNGSFMVLLPTLATGGAVYLAGSFNPQRYLEEIRRFRPTLAFMVPTMAQALIDLPAARETDWSCFDFIVTAGAPMSSELKRRTREMTGERLGELWGFTEGVATAIQPHQVKDHPGSVGRAIPTCEIRVVDECGKELPKGEIGELVGRCAIAMTGYLARPASNEAVAWKSPDGHVFMRTGDLGSIDADGWVTIKGRSKDMLISGGLNIYPADIEAVGLEHQAVQDCSVVGVSHPKWGETPVAFVKLKPSGEVGADELKTWINERVGRHQRVHDVVLVGEFPRNTLGKVVKGELAEVYACCRLDT